MGRLKDNAEGFEIQLEIDATVQAVAQLLDLRAMQDLHPLIEKLEILEERGKFVKAIVTDKLKFGFVSYRLAYEATGELISLDAESAEIHNNATSPFLLPNRYFEIYNTIHLAQVGSKCHLSEESRMVFPDKPMWVPAFIWNSLKNYTLGNAHESHMAMFIRLAEVVR